MVPTGVSSEELGVDDVREDCDGKPTGYVGLGKGMNDVGPRKSGADVFVVGDIGVVVVDHKLVGKDPPIDEENAEREQEIDYVGGSWLHAEYPGIESLVHWFIKKPIYIRSEKRRFLSLRGANAGSEVAISST
jgi:hypothetical protein